MDGGGAPKALPGSEMLLTVDGCGVRGKNAHLLCSSGLVPSLYTDFLLVL